MRKTSKFSLLAAAAIFAGSLGFTFASATSATAHASLESSNPAANSVVATAPSSVTLTFGEKLMVMAGADAANQIQVTDEAKARVDNADSKVTGEVLTVSLKPGLTDGTYSVDYRVVSEDGHPIEGRYNFTVGSAQVGGTSASSESTAPPMESPTPTLYKVQTQDDGANGTAIGIGVAIGAVIIAAAMVFLFRRLKRN